MRTFGPRSHLRRSSKRGGVKKAQEWKERRKGRAPYLSNGTHTQHRLAFVSPLSPSPSPSFSPPSARCSSHNRSLPSPSSRSERPAGKDERKGEEEGDKRERERKGEGDGIYTLWPFLYCAFFSKRTIPPFVSVFFCLFFPVSLFLSWIYTSYLSSFLFFQPSPSPLPFSLSFPLLLSFLYVSHDKGVRTPPPLGIMRVFAAYQ